MPFVCCPFCSEAGDLRILGASPAAFVVCGTCHTRGPFGESREQAIANWNRRPTSTLDLTRAAHKGLHDMDQCAADCGWCIQDEIRGSGRPALDELAAARGSTPPPLSPFLAMVVEVTDLVCPPPTTDELAAAREKRDLASLPSISTEATDAGLSMDFDLGGPPPKKR